MRQRLLLEEYGVKIKHIEGKKNVVDDALSRLDHEERSQSEECFTNTDIEDVTDFDELQLKSVERVQNENLREMSKYTLVEEPNGIKL